MAQTATPRVTSETAQQLMSEAMRGRVPSLAHCVRMFAEHGMLQFAKGDTPDPESGYCTDDNARALLVAVNAAALELGNRDANHIGESALAFLERAQLPDGRFRNMTDRDGVFINEEAGRTQEAHGRAIWALGVTLRRAPNPAWQVRAAKMLERSWAAAHSLRSYQSRAYALLGAIAAAERSETARDAVYEFAESLVEQFDSAASPDWPWWETTLTWACARAPHAMLRAAWFTRNARHRACGLRSLAFLASVTQPGDIFEPIGNKGWYARGCTRAVYDQQPIEANAMVNAWLAAADVTGQPEHRRQATRAFGWFFGFNSDGLVVARPDVGGCGDGLNPGRINPNMGAESTLSYLLAHLAIARDARNMSA